MNSNKNTGLGGVGRGLKLVSRAQPSLNLSNRLTLIKIPKTTQSQRESGENGWGEGAKISFTRAT